MMFVAWPGLRRLGDRLDRVPAGARVVLGDRDEQERDDEPDERRDVEVAEAEAAAVEAIVIGMNPSADSTVATSTAL